MNYRLAISTLSASAVLFAFGGTARASWDDCGDDCQLEIAYDDVDVSFEIGGQEAVDGCSPGTKQCVDGDVYQDCDDNGNWSQDYSCGTSFPGTVCSGGWCVYPDNGGGDDGGGDSGGGGGCECSTDDDCACGSVCDGCYCQS